MKNLLPFQLQELKAAQYDNHIANLVAIIEDLDKQITAWREATGCDTPEEVETKILSMGDTISSLSP